MVVDLIFSSNLSDQQNGSHTLLVGLLGNGDITIIELNLKTMAKRKLPEMSFDIESSTPSYELMMSPKGWEKFKKILLQDVNIVPRDKGVHEEMEKIMKEHGRGISIIGTGYDPLSEINRDYMMYKGVVCKPRIVGYGDQLEMYRAARFMQVEPFIPPPPGEVTCSSTTVPGMFDAYMKDHMTVDFKMSPSMYPSATTTSYSGSVRRVDNPDLWDKYTKSHNKYCRRRDLVDKYDPNAKVHKPLVAPTSYDIHRINESHGLRKYLIGDEYVWALNITNAKRKAKKNENRTK